MEETEVRECYTLTSTTIPTCDSGGFYLCEGCTKLMPESIREKWGWPREYYVGVVDGKVVTFIKEIYSYG